MRTNLKIGLVAVSSFFALVFFAQVFSQETSSSYVPLATMVDPRNERPKTSSINEALKRCLVDLKKAQDELRTLATEGKLKRYLDFQGVWMAVSKSNSGSTNVVYSSTFESATGPIIGFEKGVYIGSYRGRELRELRYQIGYYSDGKVKEFRRWGPGSLEFYSDGMLENFSAEIDERTSCRVTWGSDGKLVSEETSTHPPHNEKGLPALEDELRKGDYGKKAEAVSAMIEIGAASVPYALTVLKDGDEKSRKEAAYAFEFLHDDKGEYIATLVRLLREDKSPEVRRAIALALGSQGSRGTLGLFATPAAAALKEAAAKDVPEVADAAKFALQLIRKVSTK